MNITHVPRRFVSDKWGGTETYVLETAKGLQRRGHKSEIFTSAALSRREMMKYKEFQSIDFLTSIPIWG